MLLRVINLITVTIQGWTSPTLTGWEILSWGNDFSNFLSLSEGQTSLTKDTLQRTVADGVVAITGSAVSGRFTDAEIMSFVDVRSGTGRGIATFSSSENGNFVVGFRVVRR